MKQKDLDIVKETIAVALHEERKRQREEEESKPCCDCGPSKFELADLTARRDLFSKVVGELPPVYDLENPVITLSFGSWLATLTRNELFNTKNLEKEDIKLFDTFNLDDLKRYFWNQLGAYHTEECRKVIKLHSTILKEHYKNKEKGKK